jgi:hypothetical protein
MEVHFQRIMLFHVPEDSSQRVYVLMSHCKGLLVSQTIQYGVEC